MIYIVTYVFVYIVTRMFVLCRSSRAYRHRVKNTTYHVFFTLWCRVCSQSPAHSFSSSSTVVVRAYLSDREQHRRRSSLSLQMLPLLSRRPVYLAFYCERVYLTAADDSRLMKGTRRRDRVFQIRSRATRSASLAKVEGLNDFLI